MRHTELWARLEAALGSGYYRHWASNQVLAGLDGRTVTEALADGVSADDVLDRVFAAVDPQDDEGGAAARPMSR